MRLLHVKIEQGEEFLFAQALEEPGVITQGRTFDEIMINVRDAAELLLGENEIFIGLLVPANVKTPVAKKSRKQRRRAV